MEVLRCPSCGAPVSPNSDNCEYCFSFLRTEAAESVESKVEKLEKVKQKDISASEVMSEADTGDSLPNIAFQRVEEPVEKAFTVAVPQGWFVNGGIIRADLTMQMVDAQSIEAKVDFTVQNDDQASVAIRWCPTIKYCDVRMTPAAMMFSQGSNYAGMVVWPLMTPHAFIVQNLYPWAHPQNGQMQIQEQKSQPALAANYQRKLLQLGIPVQSSFDGGDVTYTYQEYGKTFKEIGSTVIENLGSLAGGMWCNRDTVLMRATADEFSQWLPILQHIYASLHLNPRWLAWEAANQEMLSGAYLNAQQAAQARERRMNEILSYMQQVDNDIANNRMQMHQSQNENYLTLTGQVEFLNPETNEIETGSNTWQNRWVNSDGGEYYSDSDDDPNQAEALSRSDWIFTPIRPRK